MAHDLILKNVTMNWARGSALPSATPVVPAVPKVAKAATAKDRRRPLQIRRQLPQMSGMGSDEEMMVAQACGGAEVNALRRVRGWRPKRPRRLRPRLYKKLIKAYANKISGDEPITPKKVQLAHQHVNHFLRSRNIAVR